MSKFGPKDDGTTHINVYSKGHTTLGRFLSNFAASPFTHPAHGFFQTIEGYWFWLGTKDRRYRYTYGPEAKALSKLIPKTITMLEEEFQNHIKVALELKIANNYFMMIELRNSTLPLTHYYYYGKPENAKVIELPEHSWLVEAIETIRTRLKAVDFGGA